MSNAVVIVDYCHQRVKDMLEKGYTLDEIRQGFRLLAEQIERRNGGEPTPYSTELWVAPDRYAIRMGLIF